MDTEMKKIIDSNFSSFDQEKLSSVLSSIEKLTRDPDSMLKNNPYFGTADISFLEDPLKELESYFLLLQDKPENVEFRALIPQKIIAEISGPINEIEQCFEKLKAFNLNTQGVDFVRNEASNILSHINTIRQAIGPHYQLFQARHTGSDTRIEEQIEEARKKNEEITQFHQAAEAATKAVRDTSAKSGVASNNLAFNELAGELNKKRRRWLETTGLFAALILGYIFYLIFGWASSGQTGSLVTEPTFLFLTRAGILAVLTTGALWCGSIYRALSQDYYAHRHRATILQTFKTFIEGTDNQTVKDGILAEAARAAFQVSAPSGKGAQQSPQFNISVGKSPDSRE